MLYRSIAWVFAFFMSLNVLGQHPVFHNLGVNEGLPGSSAYFVLNDADGYIWIAGDLGLSRFDGKNIRNYYTVKDITPNSIICMDTDSKNQIFFIASDGTLGRIRNNKPERLLVSDKLVETIRQHAASIISFKIDVNDDIHIGTTYTPYVIYHEGDYQRFEERKFEHNTYGYFYALENKKSVVSIYQASADKIFTREKRGSMVMGNWEPSKVDTGRVNFTMVEGVNPRMASVKLRNGKVLFSFLNSMFEYDGQDFRTLREFPTTILAFFEDHLGNLMVGLSNGSGMQLFENGDLNAEPKVFFLGDAIGCITQDFQGGIWMSSVENGVYYIPYLKNVAYDNFKGLNGNISDIITMDSMVYVAANNHSVYSLDAHDHVKQSEPVASINNVGDLKLRPINGQLYYCGSSSGIIDPNSLKLTLFTGPNWQNISVSTNDIVWHPDGVLIGLSYNKLYKVENNVWHELIDLKVRGNCLLYVAETNELWVGTRNGLLSYQNGSLKSILTDMLEGRVITSMVQSKSGKIFISTKNAGLYIYDHGSWSQLSMDTGLSSDFCTDVYIDAQQRVWIATKQGLNYFDEDNPEVIHILNRTNGMNSNEVNGCCIRDNNLYIVTKEGLEIIDLDHLNEPFHGRKINLEMVSVNGKDFPGQGDLSYQENNVMFQIASISYRDLFTERYAYQLAGFDPSMQITTNDVLEFKKLPPGHYDLYLADVDEAGHALEPKLYYSFDIAPPFWVRWWFVLLIVLIMLWGIFLFIRMRVAYYNRKLMEKNEIDKLIAESKLIALRAQMNPHFIFNSINSIQDFVLNNETQQAYDYLSKFAKLIRLVLNNSKENEISLEKEIEWLNVYVSLEQLRFRNSFEFQLELDDAVSENLDIRIPSMIIQPYIENAIWHGLMPLGQKRKGLLKLSCSMLGDQLVIEITDNGVGREFSSELHRGEIHISMGMSLINEKIDALKKMNHAKVDITIVDLYENNQAAGTSVRITIE